MPPDRRQDRPRPPIISIAGKRSEPERQHDQKAGKRRRGAPRLGREGIDERAWQEAVEDAKRDRRGAAAGGQQAAQGNDERVAAEAHRGPLEAVEQAEELQRHGDHQQPGDDGQHPLRAGERAVRATSSVAPEAVHTTWPSAPAERAEEAVGRQAAEIVEQVASGGCAPPPRGSRPRAQAKPPHMPMQ